MLEDLIKLKQQLEQSHRYIAISEITSKDIMSASESKSLSEFEALENTDDFIVQCEKLMEEAIRIFSANNIPYDTIQISSSLGFLCTPGFIDFLKLEYQKREGTNERWKLNLENLGSNVSLKYVPMSFSINMVESGLSGDYGVEDYLLENEKDIPQINDLSRKSVSGIIDFEKFIKRMKELGYSFELANYGECSNMYDYISAAKDNVDDTYISVNADLGLEKSYKTSYGSR